MIPPHFISYFIDEGNKESNKFITKKFSPELHQRESLPLKNSESGYFKAKQRMSTTTTPKEDEDEDEQEEMVVI